jgi:hypothetical protein
VVAWPSQVSGLFPTAVAVGLASISWSGPQAAPPTEILPASVLGPQRMAVTLTLPTIGYCAGPSRFPGRTATLATDILSQRSVCYRDKMPNIFRLARSHPERPAAVMVAAP